MFVTLSPLKRTHLPTLARQAGQQLPPFVLLQGVSRNNRNASTSYVVWKQLRQHGGLGLGTAACLGTILVYDQKDSWRVLKIIGFMVLALLGLLIHEIRPFKV